MQLTAQQRHLKVPVEGAAAPVGVVAANLALELHTQPVQLVEPVGDGLACSAKNKTVSTHSQQQG
jgi:pantothenate synthetase